MNKEKEKNKENHTVYGIKFLLNSFVGMVLWFFRNTRHFLDFIFLVLMIFSIYGSYVSRDFSSSSSKTSFLPGKITRNDSLEPDGNWVNDCSYSEKVCSQIRINFDYKQQDKIQAFLNPESSGTAEKTSTHCFQNENFIFHGKPGTGKSRCALLVAENISSFYTVVPGGTLQEIYVGSGARAWTRIINDAKEQVKNVKRPVVIIVEEIDSLANPKGRGLFSNDDTLVNTFLESIDSIKRDNLNIIILGTTNVIDFMESAAVRAGRFERLYFEYPNDKGLNNILGGVERKVESKYNISKDPGAISPSEVNSKIFVSHSYWECLREKIKTLKKSSTRLGNDEDEDIYPFTFAQIYSSVGKLVVEEIYSERRPVILGEGSGYKTGSRVLQISVEEQQSSFSGLYS